MTEADYSSVKQQQKLTPKQERFIQAYVENGGNATQAALAAYKTDYATARVIGHENLTKPNIRRELEKHMEKVDLTVEDALRTVKDALEATNGRGADWPSRLKAADMTLKLADAYPAERHQLAHTVEAPQIDFSGEPIVVLHYIANFGRLPTEEHRRILLEGTPEERRALLQGNQE